MFQKLSYYPLIQACYAYPEPVNIHMYILHVFIPALPVLSGGVFWGELAVLRCWTTSIGVEDSHLVFWLAGVKILKYLLPWWSQELNRCLPVKPAGKNVEEMWVNEAKICEPVLLSQGEAIHELLGNLLDHAGGEVTVVQNRLSHSCKVIKDHTCIEPL